MGPVVGVSEHSVESDMGQIRSVHLYGFFADDDTARPERPRNAAPSTLTTWEHFERLRRHFAKWGDEVTDCRTTRTLDGLFVAAEWTCPARSNESRDKPMWHMVVPPDDMWADFPTRVTSPEGGRA